MRPPTPLGDSSPRTQQILRNPFHYKMFSTRPLIRTLSRKSSARRRSELLSRFIRVDHAGEFGADRIYAGQMAVLGKTKEGPLIQHMWDQEKVHLATFDKYLNYYRSRPTILLPLWHVAGWALGAGTALMGKEAAMACTVGRRRLHHPSLQRPNKDFNSR